MTANEVPAAHHPSAPKGEREPRSVIIRPWPKVVFLWPTLLVAIVCWISQAAGVGEAPDGTHHYSRLLGNTFITVFFVNMLVFTFDFSRIKSITLLVLVAAVVLGLGWADATWGIAGGLRSVIDWVDVRMNTQFYGFLSVFLIAVLLTVGVNTRFNYYEINHREILHHHGYLGDITRMPTQGLRFNKEIYDLLEFLLLRSGRLIFYPSTSREAIVIDNVIGVNRVEERIKELLSVVAVRITDEDSL
ncbi:MAG: hypothetical protein IPM29_12625 [Planctomycetes bacterium]|nr:hypothetical protein [Planctomycetota bacterium]